MQKNCAIKFLKKIWKKCQTIRQKRTTELINATLFLPR